MFVTLTGFNAVRAASGAVGAILATRLLAPHDRGLMVLGITIGTVATLVAGLGIGSALRSRLPTVQAGMPRQQLIASYTWCSILAALAAGGLAVALSAASAPFVDAGLAAPPFLVAIGLVSAGYSLLTQLPDVWYASGQFGSGSAWAAIVAVVGILGMFGGAALARTAWVLLLAQGVAMVLATGVHVLRMREVGLCTLRGASWREVAYLTRDGTRGLGLTLGLVIALRLDRYVIGAVVGAAPVAVYSLAATLSSLPGLIPAALGQIALGEVAAGARLPYARRIWRAGVGLSTAASLVVGIGGWLLIVPVFGVEFTEARPLLLVLLVAEILFAPFAVASRCLLGGGWMGSAGLLGVAGSVAAVTLYVAAVPAWGLYGAAFACVALYGALSLASCLLLRQLFVTSSSRERTVNLAE